MEYRTGGQYINMLPSRICMGRVGRYVSSQVIISNYSSNDSGFGSTNDSGFVGIKVVGAPEGDTANMQNTQQLTAQFGVDGIKYGYPYGHSMHSFDVSAKRSGDVFICTVSSYYAEFFRASVQDLYITTGQHYTKTYRFDVSAATTAGILVAV